MLFFLMYCIFIVCRAQKQHKNCRPKNSSEVKSFLFSYELVHGAYDTNKSVIHITNLMCHNGLHIIFLGARTFALTRQRSRGIDLKLIRI